MKAKYHALDDSNRRGEPGSLASGGFGESRWNPVATAVLLDNVLERSQRGIAIHRRCLF